MNTAAEQELARSIEATRLRTNVLSILAYRWRTLCIGAALGLVAAIAYYLAATSKYQSACQLLVLQKETHLPVQGGGAKGDVEEVVHQDLLATHLQLISSRGIVHQGLQRAGLESLPSIKEEKRSYETPTDYVIRKLSVERGGTAQQERTANVLTVEFTHTSPEESAAVLRAVVNSYERFVDETFQSVGNEAARLISAAQVQLGADLKTAESDYVDYLAAAPLLWSGELYAGGEKRQNLAQERLAQVEAEISSLRLRLTQARTRLQVIDDALADRDNAEKDALGRLSLLDNAEVQRLSFILTLMGGDAQRSVAFQSAQPVRTAVAEAEYDQQLALILREKGLLERVGRDHPDLQEVREKISAMNVFMVQRTPALPDREMVRAGDLVQAYAELLRHDVSEMANRQEELQKLAEEDTREAHSLVRFELRGEMMRKELERKRQLYDAVLDRLREIDIMRDFGGYILKEIAPVEPGRLYWLGLLEVPRWLHFLLTVSAGTTLGFIGGGLGALVVDRLDKSMRSTAEMKEIFGVSVLSEIPYSATLLRAGGFASRGSPEAAAYRNLFHALHARSSVRDCRVLQIASLTSDDGKTTVAVNLAQIVANSGTKTLLVDCDLFRPQAYEMFDTEPSAGLRGVLGALIETPDAVRLTAIDNLWVLPAGHAEPEVATPFALRRFKEFLAAARIQFDLVILDSPALLAASDALVLTAESDGVLLVITSGSRRDNAMRVLDVLSEFRAKLLGLIVTKV